MDGIAARYDCQQGLTRRRESAKGYRPVTTPWDIKGHIQKQHHRPMEYDGSLPLYLFNVASSAKTVK